VEDYRVIIVKGLPVDCIKIENVYFISPQLARELVESKDVS